MSPGGEIQELLEKGLYHYGLGEIDKAIGLWREVLRLDPGNDTAREYLEIETGGKVEVTAGERTEPPPAVEAPRSRVHRPLPQQFFEGQERLLSGSWRGAVQAFEAAHKSDPDNPIHWAHVEMSKARLIKEVLSQVGSSGAVIRLKVDLNQLIGRAGFTQEEGFVLSLISGEMTVEDVVSLSPIPHYQTYSILYRLLSEGLLQIEERS